MTRPHPLPRARAFARTTIAAAALVAALAPAAALAQAGVRIYGVLDQWVGQNRTTAANGARSSVSLLGSGGMTTSYWGFGGSEDLGGGVTASFAVEGFLRVDSGEAGRSATDAYWARNSLVALAHRERGEIAVGRISTPTIGALFSTNAFLDSSGFGSSFVNHWGGTVLGDTAMNNALRYTSPPLGPVRVFLLVSLGEERPGNGPDPDRGQAFDGRVDYAAGPWLATLAMRRIDASNNGDGREQTMLIAGVAHDFKVVRVFGQFVSVDDRYAASASDVDRRGFSLGARVPVGTGFFIASASRSTIDDTSPATSSRRNTATVGYDHFLSKRTDLYANLLRDRLSAPAGAGLTRVGVGIRHRF